MEANAAQPEFLNCASVLPETSFSMSANSCQWAVLRLACGPSCVMVCKSGAADEILGSQDPECPFCQAGMTVT